jgi:DNA-binding transcriptional ArsR family regulator
MARSQARPAGVTADSVLELKPLHLGPRIVRGEVPVGRVGELRISVPEQLLDATRDTPERRSRVAVVCRSIVEAIGRPTGVGQSFIWNLAQQRPYLPLACRQSVRYILNHMVQSSGTRLDASFARSPDATRRGVLEQLGRADASITDLAEKFHMTLTGMKKHVGVLEQAGLVATEKVGRVRTCKLGRADWSKRRHGSRGTASSGLHASTSWTRLSRN